MRRSTNKKNYSLLWKILFFSLLSMNIVFFSVFGFILYPLLKPVSEQELPDSQPPLEMAKAPFYIHATKESITETLNLFLDNADEDKFTILLDDYVLFKTEIAILGMNVTLHVKFEPSVVDNGNLLLKQKSISFGILQIPNEYALQYIANTLELPNWVSVHPNEEIIYIDIHDAQINSNFLVQFEQFNLTENEIIMQLYVNK